MEHARRSRYDVLRSREYAGLLLGRVVSLVGDQMARVALSVLVYQHTRSPLLSAVAYAITFVPAAVGGPLLGGLADRLPRRRLLIAVDLARAALFAVMALPGVPLGALLALLLVACTLESPWAAARAPLMREVLRDDDGYQVGTGLDEALNQAGQVLGFAGAGALLVVLSPRSVLLLDAASFVVSALVLRLALRERPAADRDGAPGRRLSAGLADARAGWSAALAPACRRPLLLTWATLTCAVTPEALATPWAAELGAGPRGLGLLFAAAPVGTALAVLAVSRVPAERAARLLVPLAVTALLPLVLCLLHPPLAVAVALVAVSGTGASASLLARVAFVRGVAPDRRGRAFAVAASGVTGLQGLGIAAAGALAGLTGAASAVGVAGLVGLAGLLLVVRTTPRGGPAPAPEPAAGGPALPAPLAAIV